MARIRGADPECLPAELREVFAVEDQGFCPASAVKEAAAATKRFSK